MSFENNTGKQQLELTVKDREQLARNSITVRQLHEQIAKFEKGATPASLHRAAVIGDGIHRFDEAETDRLVDFFSEHAPYLDIIKFVPASGAATRMFKTLLGFYNSNRELTETVTREKAASGDPDYKFLLTFIEGIKNRRYAFWNDLNEVMKRDRLNLDRLAPESDFRPVLEYLLTSKGLDYANLPKALLKFHRYSDHIRTALEEHLAEGLAYSKGKNNRVRIHMTLSSQFQNRVNRCLEEELPRYEKNGVVYEIEFSQQHASTDTIAVDEENRPLRDDNGHLVIRPGGHGSLIENLDEIDGDIIFIKNIDNIVPDRLKKETVLYKKMLGGCLMEIRETVHGYLRKLQRDDLSVDTGELSTMFDYCRKYLNIEFATDFLRKNAEEQCHILKEKLDRPIRVCGMVKNQGEPGGGPFWLNEKDGTHSLQIVEGAQIDQDSPTAVAILHSATHFNPVDLVCCTKNYRGEKFDLMKFIDPDAYFISSKSINGKSLKALELPGLWNGAMARWITVFVEVPIITFNPIKTVNDLLRKEHL